MDTTWSKPAKYAAGVAIALFALYVISLSLPVVPLLIIAALLAVIVHPLITLLHRILHLPRGLAVAIAYIILALLIPLALILLIPSVIDAVHYVLSLDYASILHSISAWLKGFLTSLRDIQLPVSSLDSYVDRAADSLLNALQSTTQVPGPVLPMQAAPPSGNILQPLSTVLMRTFGVAAGVVTAIFSSAVMFIFVMVVSVHMTLSAHEYREAIVKLAPASYQPEVSELMEHIKQVWNSFFRGQIVLMIVIGVLAGIGLTILGVPGALYLAIIAGLLEIIPTFGPFIATIPAVLVALLQGSTHFAVSPFFFAIMVVLFYILIQQVENTIVVPRVLGGAINLSPIIVMTGVLVGAEVGGILGALLATPVIATARELLGYLLRKMQGESPFPPLETTTVPKPSLIQSLRTLRHRLSRS